MSIPSAKRNTTEPGAPDFNTLDEPIKETIVSRQNTWIPIFCYLPNVRYDYLVLYLTSSVMSEPLVVNSIMFFIQKKNPHCYATVSSSGN